jgi:hypothetical protein
MNKVIVFGVRNSADVLESIADRKKMEIIFYCDNDATLIGKIQNNVKIIKPNDLNKVNFDYLIISPRNAIARKQIKLQLEKLKISNEKIIDFYDYISGLEHKLSILAQKKDYEVFVTGLSYAMLGIDEKYMKKPTINFSYESQDLYYDYNIAKHVINNYDNQFKYAVLGISYYSFDYDLSKSVNQSKTLLYYETLKDLHNYNKNNIGDFIKNKKDIYSKCEKVFIDDFIKISYELPNSMMSKEKIVAQRDLPYLDSNKDYPETVKENVNILYSYLKLLNENNVKSIIVVFPCSSYYYKHFSTRLEKRFYNIINSLKNNIQFEFYDYFKSDLFKDDDFIDISHLNKQGSQKMSEIISNIIDN